MGMHDMAMRFVRIVEGIKTADDLTAAMATVTADLGFEYFAITHHVDIVAASGSAIRLHNYPQKWADYYDGRALGVSDPVHRASHVTSLGFRWSRMPQMIPLTAEDRRMLVMGREEGIGDGFTVPANVPGESRGSCSFASGVERPLPVDMLPLAQLAGAFAFEGARRLWTARGTLPTPPPPALTDRQRDCVLWAARGKSDWEISRILGVGEETVIRHIKQARERYGVQKRTSLAIRTLFDGTLTFTDVLKR
jgi:LuxR family quorum-sensing system transcriptional regulator CciR